MDYIKLINADCNLDYVNHKDAIAISKECGQHNIAKLISIAKQVRSIHPNSFINHLGEAILTHYAHNAPSHINVIEVCKTPEVLI